MSGTENQEIQTGTEATAPENTASALPPAESIDKVIKESNATLDAAKKKPPKRSRGRPRKHPRPELARALGGDTEPAEGAESLELEAPAPAPLPPVDMRQEISYLAHAGSQSLAASTGCAGLELNDAERAIIAERINALIQKYCPNLGAGELSTEMAAVVSIGGIVMAKWVIFKKWKEMQAAEKAAKDAQADPSRDPDYVPAASMRIDPFSARAM